ncbi:MAG: alpha/beta hydrolase [Burkholderiales bacterium]|nr:alpha/beta hydrolase [Burkholderiales bacterium]
MSQLRFRLAGFIIAAFVSAAPSVAAALEAPAPAMAAENATQFVDLIAGRYGIQSNVTYSIANNVELKLDLYLPRNAKEPVPLVINFHGGGWVEGNKEGSMLGLLRYMQMGFAVANVGYRLGRVSPAPAAVEDTRCALRWLTRRATQYKFDTRKIVLTGGSAGGHLALITGMLPAGNPYDRACATDDNTRWVSGTEPPLAVAAIINYFGIADVEDLLTVPNAKHYAIEWLGAATNREALARSVSPIQYVRTGLPAIFTVHGDADQLVPHAHSTRLHAALNKAGVPNEMMTIPGGGHGGFSSDESLRISDSIRAFLTKQGISAITH